MSFPGERAKHRIVYPASISRGASRPPTYPVAPVRRMRLPGAMAAGESAELGGVFDDPGWIRVLFGGG